MLSRMATTALGQSTVQDGHERLAEAELVVRVGAEVTDIEIVSAEEQAVPVLPVLSDVMRALENNLRKRRIVRFLTQNIISLTNP